MRSIELFAGAGGLALGSSLAGFKHEAIVEWDADACETLRENKRRGVQPIAEWPDVEQADVTTFDFTRFRRDVDLLSGGVPCQPWSLGGKHRGHRDDRNLFPDMVRAVRDLQPRAILVENVKGLQRKAFANYFEYIKHQLRYPELVLKPGESWLDHLARLERYHTYGDYSGLWYRVLARVLNAADYGVPQKRERVFVVAFRSDLEIEWSFPQPSHSLDALLVDQYVTGNYWERHRVPRKQRTPVGRFANRIERLRSSLFHPLEEAWVTVRDAIADLPNPERAGRSEVFANHFYVPGARSYAGHTGSPIDEPSKTLKAGVHGVPGGENTVLYPDGRFRYLTVRESARIQTFPDAYVFRGSWTESMRQLGNAVPVSLARGVAGHIAKQLQKVARIH